jgi:hypothetical protein
MDKVQGWLAAVPHGTRVKVVYERERDKGYVANVNALREKGHLKKGEVVAYSNSHGICYTVNFDDGTWGIYDPEELDELRRPA